MAWMKLETSVARNRKFVQAGPAPAWLWVCGLAYCQEGLTDGFIPAEALKYLGVKNPGQLAHHLVAAGLWDEVEGGWEVHDYFGHNKPASEVRRLVKERQDAGAEGGKASGEARRTKQTAKQHTGVCFDGAKQTVKHTSNPAPTDSTALLGSAPTAPSGLLPTSSPCDVPLDVWFRELKATYPEQAVTSGYLTESAWCQVFIEDLRPAVEVWTEMQLNLENQKQGYQWRVKHMIPKLEKWLREGLWKQRHDATPPSTLVNEKTARTLLSGSAFVAGGDK